MYEKQEWSDLPEQKTPINAKRMNHIEEGIYNASNVYNVTEVETDLNDYIETGTYFFNSSYTPLNIPVGVNGWLEVIKGSGTWVKQIWYRAGTANSNDFQMYIRTNNGDGWSEWHQLAVVDKTYNTINVINEITSDYFELYSENNRHCYIKLGNIVILFLSLKTTSQISANTNYDIEMDIPKASVWNSNVASTPKEKFITFYSIRGEKGIRVKSAETLASGTEINGQLMYITTD